MFNFLNNALQSETKYKIEGVPQGSPLSPILSILMLEHTILRNPKVIMYADDGVVLAKKLTLGGKEEEDMEDLNIELNYGKSRLVKKDGV
jgi:retron-type reverse transcriptase